VSTTQEPQPTRAIVRRLRPRRLYSLDADSLRALLGRSPSDIIDISKRQVIEIRAALTDLGDWPPRPMAEAIAGARAIAGAGTTPGGTAWAPVAGAAGPLATASPVAEGSVASISNGDSSSGGDDAVCDGTGGGTSASTGSAEAAGGGAAEAGTGEADPEAAARRANAWRRLADIGRELLVVGNAGVSWWGVAVLAGHMFYAPFARSLGCPRPAWPACW
jgi:hypothetical protein